MTAWVNWEIGQRTLPNKIKIAMCIHLGLATKYSEGRYLSIRDTGHELSASGIRSAKRLLRYGKLIWWVVVAVFSGKVAWT